MKNLLFLLSLILVSCESLNAQTEVENGKYHPNWSNRYISSHHIALAGMSIYQGNTHVASGQFGRNMASVTLFDGKHLSLDLSLFTASYNTGFDARTDSLKGKNWLNTEKNMMITLNTYSSVKTEDGFELKGQAHINGHTVPVNVHTHISPVKQTSNQMNYVELRGIFEIKASSVGINGKTNWAQSPWRMSLDDRIGPDTYLKFNFNMLAQNWTADWGKTIFLTDTESHIYQVYSTLQSNGIKAALKRYDELKAANPDDDFSNTLGYLAFVLTLEAKLDKKTLKNAYELFEHSIKHYPKNTTAKRNYAETLAMGGDFKKAQQLIDEIKASEPDLLDVEFYRHYPLNIK